MAIASSQPLHQQTYSLDHDRFEELLATTENLLIIQDLDGVCMGLVKDPRHRTIQPAYVEATQAFDGHFYVLTNGEHIGQRGVNGIIERAYGDAAQVRQRGLYLPGLAAGGVQWQTRQGELAHPGVSEAELAFLRSVPEQIRQRLRAFFRDHPTNLDDATLEPGIAASALENVASPTANLNTFHELLQDDPATYNALQHAMAALMEDLLAAAAAQGLADSFFVHYAPNHGRGNDGKETVWFSQGPESGTTDFQFMLRGAIKEAGVLALLNRYYAQRTGTYPLGPEFSVRQAPHDHEELVALVRDAFDPAQMPTLVGVGDTVTSQVFEVDGRPVAKRGGSDRNFLQLIQDIGRLYDNGNVVTYVDSSGGELKNRKALQIETVAGHLQVVAGPGDPRDSEDPLTLNVVFPGGYQQYCATFQAAARRRD
ncbi:Glucosylglycerol-phosphate phosphatase [Halomicronema hongdechloris C2206]|uniref:Glucosylglycerol-phosphate phosphatase n=1 Tax=Halomicronema hongdechloris C2206 TaxID=1641165 RepID=A0A1Z3HJI0_9CYAN|nr:glucosylglycerol 3-phosphatase [Halomicronema hongdechloris]ASC70267.1 Glucosylglycerol-phosphate phosphatase [Halomicronema hongdechloris C2206]